MKDGDKTPKEVFTPMSNLRTPKNETQHWMQECEDAISDSKISIGSPRNANNYTKSAF